MTKKSVTSLALAAGCALALAMPAAQAQTQTRVMINGPEWTPGDSSASAARNNAESVQYDRLLERSPAFRQARMRKECGPITDAQLHQNCLASFAQDENRGGDSFRGASTSSDQMTGGSSGTMSTTTTGANPEAYGEGSGSSANYTTPRNAYGASRNLPAEQSGGMVQAPGAMPNYPGPRLSGPMSGGGAK